MPRIALSVRQPWATLIVLGIKELEVRRWSTKRTGRIYIHAGKQIDRRARGWKLVPEEHLALLDLRGGLVGSVELIGCRTYRTGREFARDRQKHWNRTDWYVPPRMHAFEFADPQTIPFEAVKGRLYFFEV